METAQLLNAILALAFVLGLLLLLLWLIKYCQQKGLNCCFQRHFKPQSEFTVKDRLRLDAKNTLVLLHCHDEEFLLLLGATNNLLIKSSKIQKENNNS